VDRSEEQATTESNTMSDPTERIQAFADVPVHRFLGFRMISPSPEEVFVEMDVSPDVCQETGVVHGGILSSLADATAANLFQPYVPDHLVTTSIEFKMNFLRPVLADRGKLVARATVLRKGRKVALAEVEITQAEKMVAKGLFTFLFVDKSDWSDNSAGQA
jgi:1,4-dihydroxy-2-naphthoyl-CoA hydrolase